MQKVVDKAVDFLKSSQLKDGSFSPKIAGPGITAIVVAGMVRCGVSTQESEYGVLAPLLSRWPGPPSISSSSRCCGGRTFGGAVARSDRDPGRAVAIQVHHPLDGDQLLRRPDRRFRHHRFLLSIFPDLRTILLIVAVADRFPAADHDLAARSVPRAAARFRSLAARPACAAHHRPVARRPGGALGAVPGHQSRLDLRALRRHDGYELSTKGWIDFDTTTSDQLRAAADETCHPSGKPPNIIMVLDEASFDITAVPGIKVPPGLRRHFQSFDGKKRSLRGRRLRRADLVHRIQCADRTVGALLRPLELLRHAHRRRPRQARPAAGAAALRLQDHLALSGLRRVPQRAQFQKTTGVEPLPRLRRHEGRRLRARSLLLRSGAADDRAREGRSAAVHFRLHRCSIIFPGGTRSGPS